MILRIRIGKLRKKGFLYTAILLWLVSVSPAATDTDLALLGDQGNGSRAVPVHFIPLLDEEGEKIAPGNDPLLPFSIRKTCGSCHNYEKISKGWHFNAANPAVASGRPGQPWIFVDTETATQIPLSYRSWQGTFRPEQIGMTPWQFTEAFGRQMPGGGAGELDEADSGDEVMRRLISGKLEINCLSCHNSNPGQDQAEYAVQIASQNFRWAATASCEFASVAGSAKSMPGTYDPFMPEELEDPKLVPPTVTYRENAFDHKKQVFFDVGRKIPAERCYFCHSSTAVSESSSEEPLADEDVHLAAGLTCVDCHGGGIDHSTIRGYESEAETSSNPLVALSSCKGCHLGEESSSAPVAGRLGAPKPKHIGIPVVHFEKLTCTACHSGIWPNKKAYNIKTSQSHGLGTHGISKSADILPHIISPVFSDSGRPDGKIAPNNLIWPAFWAGLKEQKVTPVSLEVVRSVVGKIIAGGESAGAGNWPALTSEQITTALKAMSSMNLAEGKPVYICGGKLYQIDDKTTALVAVEHDAAKPYLWPIAHDVRPAAQSLGVRSCKDCHSTDAPVFFGDVAVDSPLAPKAVASRKMIEFMEVDPVYTRLFAMSFVFRPWLKVVALATCAVLAGVLLLYALKALCCIARIMVGKD